MRRHPDTEQPPTVDSPCVRNCCLNDADVCFGCGRTLQEILDWHALSDTQRREVIERAAGRRPQRMP